MVTIKAPAGSGEKMAQTAFDLGIARVGISRGRSLQKDGTQTEQDIVEIETMVPNAKKFLERLMVSSYYDPETFHFTTVSPQSIFASERPEDETKPFVRPTTDVYEELWQFVRITTSLVLRVFLAAFLLAYGMKEDFMPMIIAGLLFLPYHHHLLGMGMGEVLKEPRLLRQAITSFLLATGLIFAGGVVVALLTAPGIQFSGFEIPLIFSFLISLAIGVAAGLAATDEAGNKELIGLAATAHVSIYPAWFGMKLIHGFLPSERPMDHLLAFGVDVLTITVFAALTFMFVKMNGEGIRRFVRAKEKKGGISH